MTTFLDTLNPAQREAVINFEGPSLIVAGAGSGKTRVLTSRIAYMIEQGVYPGSILALTFTNKAAAEMRERIRTLVGDAPSRYIWMGTFHSVFYRILRSEAGRLGFDANFTIYDTGNSESLLGSIVKEFNLNTDEYKPREIHSRISLAKNNLVTAEGYAANDSLVAEDRQRKRPEFSRIYLEYARRCRANNAMDFDDLLIYTNILFRDFPDVLAFYQHKFRYILVDEYQDTNYAQYLIIRRLGQAHSNVCVVGDDAQSIYSFRGAKIENILQFRNDFPDAKVFKLEQNYRSTRNIVDAANSIIAKNANRIEKTVFSEKERGEKIRVVKAYTDQEEAYIIADMIKAVGRETRNNWNEIAVLYRNNSQSRALEDALRRRDIPYVIYKGHSFYERKEIKDLVAYFRLIVNLRDNEAFKRVINTPARGIGPVTVGRLAETAASRGVRMWEVADGLDREAAPELKTAAKRIMEFVELIRDFSLRRNEMPLYDFGLDVATRSGIIGSYRMNPSPESDSALENIGELLGSMQNFLEQRISYEEEDSPAGEPTIEEWLQNISLMTDADKVEEEARNRVVLMTVHSAKGLEFDTVFIAGVEENLFPSLMSTSSPDKLEEERRLFYVALTRARDKAVVSFATSRFKWGSTEFCRPSRFITEIDARFVDLPAGMDDDDPADEDPLARLRKKFGFGMGGNSKQSGTGIGNSSRQSGAGNASRQSGAGNASRQSASGMGKPQNQAVSGMGKSQNGPASGVGGPQTRFSHPSDGRFRSVGSRKSDTSRESAPNEPRTGADGPKLQSDSGAKEYAIGGIVEHAKFGRGEIAAIEDLGSDIKITVIFDDPSAGKKTLLSRYANLTIIN